MNQVKDLKVSGAPCRYLLVVVDGIGYVVVFSPRYDALDFGQFMCCHKDAHEKLGAAIKANRNGLSKIILCSTYSKCNEELGVDATFNDLTPGERDEIKEKVIPRVASYICACRRIAANEAEVRRLINELRYEDARMHCAVCGLDFENFLYEARKRLNPQKSS